MASYVYVKNPNGTTYVYENESYWDKPEQKTKHHRKCVGKLHPETNAIIPTVKHLLEPRRYIIRNHHGIKLFVIVPAALITI